MKKLFTLLLFITSISSFAQQVTLIPAGASWKYLDNGSNQGTAWRAVSFNDASWASGNSELGYGDGGEATVVSYGSNANYKHITTYFRKSFTVNDPAAYSALTLNLLRDDGAVVYLNGTQIAKSNLPSGTIGYTTRASASITGTAESTYYNYTPATSLLITGTNVIAVEIHQFNRTNADISFNLKLLATTASVCATPAALAATSVTSTAATLSCQVVTGAISYNFRYRVTGASTWITLNNPSASVQITGLSPASNYEYSVQAICSSSTGSYSSNATFTTLSAAVCGTPASLTTTGITSSTATAGWQVVAGASGYNIQYRVLGAVTWINVNSITNSITFTGLTPGTTYEYAVQAACTSGTGNFSLAATFATFINGNDSLITTFASWKYLDNGTNQGTSWYAPSFNDATWLSGNAELGYGDGDEATLLGFGSNASAKYITTYFRKSFNVTNPAIYAALTLSVVRDDGIVVYLNGNEVYRNNMPSGTIAYNTLAPTAIAVPDESAWYTVSLNASSLIQGTNVIAVEIHQQALTSSDISFKARLIASGSAPLPVITRGAYIQMLTPTSATIRWRTNIACNSKVSYGTSLSYGSGVSDATNTTEHIVNITGLNPETQYYYSIGTSNNILQGDVNNNFYTAPLTGSQVPVRIWVTGDFGNGSTQQASVRNSFVNYSGTTPTNLWLWLGDNAYATGTDVEYQSYVFNIYPEQLKSIPLYPSPGNHDYGNAGYQNSSTLTTNFPYFNIFSVPQAGEAGGVASATPKYYSYNYANIHFISLDSYGSYNNSSSAMYNWLSNDLAANTQRWTVVYFHHPPYTKGTHNSDTDTELINMRTNIIPLLENYHVDLVLSGHSHVNERSYLIKGHYGSSTTFTQAMKMSAGTNAFTKSAPFDGTVYAICGTSGQNPGTVQAGYPMPCMFFGNNSNNCSLIMDVLGDNLTCKYLASTGVIIDQFSITKTGARMMAAETPEKVKVSYDMSDNLLIIDYYLEKESHVEMDFINMTGNNTVSMDNNVPDLAPGFHRMEMEAPSLPSGVYILKVTINNQHYFNKIVIP